MQERSGFKIGLAVLLESWLHPVHMSSVWNLFDLKKGKTNRPNVSVNRFKLKKDALTLYQNFLSQKITYSLKCGETGIAMKWFSQATSPMEWTLSSGELVRTKHRRIFLMEMNSIHGHLSGILIPYELRWRKWWADCITSARIRSDYAHHYRANNAVMTMTNITLSVIDVAPMFQYPNSEGPFVVMKYGLLPPRLLVGWVFIRDGFTRTPSWYFHWLQWQNRWEDHRSWNHFAKWMPPESWSA